MLFIPRFIFGFALPSLEHVSLSHLSSGAAGLVPFCGKRKQKERVVYSGDSDSPSFWEVVDYFFSFECWRNIMRSPPTPSDLSLWGAQKKMFFPLCDKAFPQQKLNPKLWNDQNLDWKSATLEKTDSQDNEISASFFVVQEEFVFCLQLMVGESEPVESIFGFFLVWSLISENFSLLIHRIQFH